MQTLNMLCFLHLGFILQNYITKFSYKFYFLRMKLKIQGSEWSVHIQAFQKILTIGNWEIPTDLRLEDTVKN